MTPDDSVASLFLIVEAKQALELLIACANKADEGSVSISEVQSLANLRALSKGQFMAVPDLIADCEASIRKAQKTGALDPKLKSLDPNYVAYLCGEISSPDIPSRSLPIPGPPHGSALNTKRSGCAGILLLAFTIASGTVLLWQVQT